MTAPEKTVALRRSDRLAALPFSDLLAAHLRDAETLREAGVIVEAHRLAESTLELAVRRRAAAWKEHLV